MNPLNNEEIRGCDDFQSLIPAYLEGRLSTARKLLLEDHSNECVPCRKEVKAQRNLAQAKSAAFVAPSHTPRVKPAAARKAWTKTSVARWSVAAAVAICVGLAAMFAYERVDLSGRTMAATLDNADGQVYIVSNDGTHQLTVGEQLL